MSKISVFKFNLNGQSNENANNIINNYIASRSLNFDSTTNAYTTANHNNNSTATDMAKSIALSTAATIATGGATAITKNKLDRGFEYYFANNELIIKAYLINNMINAKQMIHSTFNNSQPGAMYYSDLKHNLFKTLESNNITLTNVSEEKINDGSEKKLATRIIIILTAMVIVSFLLVIILINVL